MSQAADLTPAEATLLSQPLEAFQTLAVGSDEFIISVLDVTTDLPSALTGIQRTWLFAEQLLLDAPLDMVDGVVAVHSLSSTEAGGAALSIAGAAGSSTLQPNMNPSAPGTAGGPGTSAQTLALYVESAGPYTPDFAIAARGGDGGAGQRGGAGCPGADGGPGGDGGQVTVVAGLPSLAWLAQLRVAAALTTTTACAAALGDLLATMPTDDPRLTAARAAVGAAIAATDGGDQQAALEQAAQALSGLSVGFAAAVGAATDVSAGRYGVYGDGTPNGKGGAPGTTGALSTTTFGTPAQLATTPFAPFFFAHPSQCARLLERAKLQYLVLDPVGNPSGVTDLMTLLLRLQARTQAFVDAPDASPLIAFYEQNEAQIGAVGSVAQLRALYDQATRLLGQLKQGKDLFGNDADSVPLGSFGFYKDLLGQLIGNFTAIETAYESYFTELAANAAQMASIRSALTQQATVQQNAQVQLPSLEALALKTASIIDGYQVTLPPLKAALDKAMNDLQTEIANTFHFDFSMLVSALSSLALAPDSEVMMVSTAASFLYNGSTQVVNDQGVPVQTKYLVGQVKSVQATVDGLTEGFSQLDDGTLAADDPAAGKLLAEEGQITTLMSQFDGQFTDALAELKTAFDAYVGQVVDRNNQILNYNATVLLMLRDQQLIAQAQANAQTLTDQQLQTMEPGLPSLASFVSGVYYAARSQVMETLDLTARAFRFWALSDEDLLASAYGGKAPPEIDSTALVAAQDEILGSYQQAIESFGTNASSFPAQASEPGLVVQVPAAQVALLGLTNQLMVSLPVVTPSTTAAASPFAGMADVRVMLVRVWIDGAKTANGTLQVHVTHTGRETLCDTSGNAYRFTHEPIAKLFRYTIEGGAITEEANFGCAQTTSTGTTELYAAVGPFTTWQVQVKAADNVGLDLSGVTGVRLEFHGTNLAFP